MRMVTVHVLLNQHVASSLDTLTPLFSTSSSPTYSMYKHFFPFVYIQDCAREVILSLLMVSSFPWWSHRLAAVHIHFFCVRCEGIMFHGTVWKNSAQCLQCLYRRWVSISRPILSSFPYFRPRKLCPEGVGQILVSSAFIVDLYQLKWDLSGFQVSSMTLFCWHRLLCIYSQLSIVLGVAILGISLFLSLIVSVSVSCCSLGACWRRGLLKPPMLDSCHCLLPWTLCAWMRPMFHSPSRMTLTSNRE